MQIVVATLMAAAAAAPPTPRDYFGSDAFDRPRACVGAPLPTAPMPLLTDFRGQWYLKHLRAAGEPPLRADPKVRAKWRFTWLPSFNTPVVVRIEQTSPRRMRLVARRLSGHGGYDPGEIAETRERWLTPAEQRKVLAAAAQAEALDTRDCRLMTDGAQWIFESASDGRHRMTDANTPASGPLRDLGVLFLGLTGWPLEP
ncbi:MAG TPA: hypothetical protein VEA79_12080 [Phenylobacterium sp.]|nr:hypothetical protein [Phenylobacterium sp.]